ncbi:hypothetical protein JTB14_000945 [Gonioctena quinquepunctata]|nr:hypothetical protein JTB14_000945 [Gonioctena quinquepunctata]
MSNKIKQCKAMQQISIDRMSDLAAIATAAKTSPDLHAQFKARFTHLEDIYQEFENQNATLVPLLIAADTYNNDEFKTLSRDFYQDYYHAKSTYSSLFDADHDPNSSSIQVTSQSERVLSSAKGLGITRTNLEASLVNVSTVDGPYGHENPCFGTFSRKTSAIPDHAEIEPVEKIISHGIDDIESSHSYEKNRNEKHSNGDLENENERCWWYEFCLKCRSKQDGPPSWQPKFWSKLCPHPFCPTYRQFSRVISLTLIGLLSWCVLYAMAGDIVAPPDGKLFQLILLTLSAHLGGWLMSFTTLPGLIGMLFTGLIFQNVNIVDIDESFSGICKHLRNVALVILLIRAGLDLDPIALPKLKFTIFKMGLLPWIVDSTLTATLSVFLLDLSWTYGIFLGSIVAAVSPAVVVPCLFRLRSRGYGVVKGIPTLVIAIAGITDAVSVAVFGIIKNIIFSSNSLAVLIIQGPLSLIGGIGFGVIWGFFCNYSPERNDPFVAPLRILLLLVGGMISVFGTDLIGFGGAGPVACITVAFVSMVCWSKQGWDIEDNPAATAFRIFWMIFEPMLFGITGATIKLNLLDGKVAAICVGIIVTVAVMRIICTILLGIGCHLNLREKIFVSISCMSKASVQAALGPVALGMVTAHTTEYHYAEKILTTCVLSIILTAPTSAILMTLLGPRFLTKTRSRLESDGWRRSQRLSIRDITIPDDKEERGGNTTQPEDIIIE